MLLENSRRFGNSKKISKNDEYSSLNCSFRSNSHDSSGYRSSQQLTTKSNNLKLHGKDNTGNCNGFYGRLERKKKLLGTPSNTNYPFQNENSPWRFNSHGSGNCRRSGFTPSNYRERSSGTSFGERFQGIMKYDEPEQIFNYNANYQRVPGLGRGITSRRSRFNQHN